MPSRHKWSLGLRLREVIILGLGMAILIGPAVNRWQLLEIAMRWRRGGRPFQRIGVPRITIGLLAPEQTQHEVGHKNELRNSKQNGTD